MLQRGLSSALRLHCSARAFATRARGAQASCTHTLHAKTAETEDHFDGFSTYCAIRGVSAFSFGASERDLGLSPCTQHQPEASGVHYLQQTRSISADHALIARLATIWNIPAEILHANVRALQNLLKGCGRDTSAHALWAMVRCPELRHADGDQLRTYFRQLTEAVQHLDLDKPTLLAVVYRRPWMLHAARTAALRARMQPRKQNVRSTNGSNTTKSTASNSNAGSETDNEDSNSSGNSSCSNGKYTGTAPWNQELALLLMEWYASNAPKVNNSSIRASPTLALAAVRSYMFAAEVTQQLLNAVSSINQAANGTSAAAQPPPLQTQQQRPSTALAASSSAGAVALAGRTDRCSSAGSPQHYQHQQDDGSHLQHLLEVCPPLTLLPPDILLSRWHLLLSGLFGSPQSAAALLMCNPYIVVSYADFERENSPYEVEGFDCS